MTIYRDAYGHGMLLFIQLFLPCLVGLVAALGVIGLIKYLEHTRAAAKAHRLPETPVLGANATLTGNAAYDSLNPLVQETESHQFPIDANLASGLKETIARIEAYKATLAGVPDEIINGWITEWRRVSPTQWVGLLGVFHKLSDSPVDPGVLYPVVLSPSCFERQRQYPVVGRQLTIWDQVTPPWGVNPGEVARFPGEIV